MPEKDPLSFEQLLNQIRSDLLLMAGLVDRSVSLALRSLFERDDRLAETVEREDVPIDELEVKLDEAIVTYIATHQPVATDCRFMIVTTQISSNLERIADLAVGIARRAKALNREPQLKPYIDLPRMGNIVLDMIRGAIQCFIQKAPEEALQIIRKDKEVDGIRNQLSRELVSFMIEDPATITRALHLLFIAHSLERMADHGKNIAEEVYYLYRAEDIRHRKELVEALAEGTVSPDKNVSI
ncbi:phosphate signaling complex protein PhoU [Candidatus Methylacidithermus pantelleriae]|uniref:Phosphate-specific transport system accessory protein PhoU n=1 Tax=Candidatus Methylacidithermus pantelleriae TaxID=2744239 RepID=A0A8J2BLC3_9BACT|nr:phosphate signaling complex protein PhoU [Candidatus Methylacidithermus pantelleriae]CAF0696026.1 Phosphate-specific transport system accessory protein PhoU [Candidatus Methylacidithermus pantelleriae]